MPEPLGQKGHMEPETIVEDAIQILNTLFGHLSYLFVTKIVCVSIYLSGNLRVMNYLM